MEDFDVIWVYLKTLPLFYLTVTILAYQIGVYVYDRSHKLPYLNPVPIAVAIIIFLLIVMDAGYYEYFYGAQFVHFLLGPATVALAVPIYKNFHTIRSLFFPSLISILTGSLVGLASIYVLVDLFDISQNILVSVAPKSVTTPVAMSISENLGGLPSLTAACVVLTGVLTASIGPVVLNILKVRDWRARGLSLGTAGHGIATARALDINEQAATFSGFAFGLNALISATLLPFLLQ